MSSHADHAILMIAAQGRPPLRQIQLLAALGSVKPHPGGLIRVSQVLLGELTGLSSDTVKLARTELVKAGVIEYQPGTHRGQWSTYRITVERPKGLERRRSQPRPSPPSEPGKGGRSDPERGGGAPPEGGESNRSDQREHRDRVEVPQSGSTPSRSASLLERCRDVVPDLDEGEFRALKKWLRSTGSRSADAVINWRLTQGSFAEQVEEYRERDPDVDSERGTGTGTLAPFQELTSPPPPPGAKSCPECGGTHSHYCRPGSGRKTQ